MFPVESIPDDVFLEIFWHLAYDGGDPILPKSWTSSCSAALRDVALSCRRFFDLTAALRREEMWCESSDAFHSRMLHEPVSIDVVEGLGGGNRATYRKITISLGKSQYWLHRGIYLALPRFSMLRELALYKTVFSIQETYPLLASLPSLRVFGAIGCNIVSKMSPYGRYHPKAAHAQFEHFRPPKFDLRKLELTHLTLDLRSSLMLWKHDDPSIMFYHPMLLLFTPTLRELELLWIDSECNLATIYTTVYANEDRLSEEEKAAVFAALTSVRFRVRTLSASAVQNALWLLKLCPHHPDYDGLIDIARPRIPMEVHWRISKYTSTVRWVTSSYYHHRWYGRRVKYDDSMTSSAGEIDVLGHTGLPDGEPGEPEAGILASCGVSSYEGPLECIGYFIGPTPEFHSANKGLSVKEEWAKAELTPEPLGIEDLFHAVDTDQEILAPTRDHCNVIDSGLRRLVLKPATTYKKRADDNSSAVCQALTLFAVGRMASFAHPDDKGFTRIEPTTRMVACNLQHIDLHLDMFRSEVLYAIRTYFRKTIVTIVLRVKDYEAADTSTGIQKSLIYHKDMNRMGGDIVAAIPHLQSFSLIHTGAAIFDTTTMTTIQEDVKDFVVAWGTLSTSLTAVQVDRFRFEKLWGKRWIELNPRFYKADEAKNDTTSLDFFEV